MSSGNTTDNSTKEIEIDFERAFLERLSGNSVPRYKARQVTTDIDDWFRELSIKEQGIAIHKYPKQLTNQTIKM